ncbi:ArsR family transcriptional regulator [Mastigocoleus sp. MO_188.B34]|uniref:ArsR family transcriptional regulator n=1 Tax=Mastigocoleus sp. MO_188.B34 TaxID=3036635 RepID=UPI00263020C2|nr:ArsR family transcriptional regulator [Mastigocoleus sp. MO_188.B34]MDJ0695650.1 ArsR family transcriptional regulator [Mastigocoleus sp. MO_188.B34]
MGYKMGGLFEGFQNWLHKNRELLLSAFPNNEKEDKETEVSLTELPLSLKSKLVAAIENLPSNDAGLEAIHSKLDEALEEWHENPKTADNSLIILSSPVTTVSRILTNNLNNWAANSEIPLRYLQLNGRPAQKNIITELREQLDREEAFTEAKQPEIVVIPNLNWCYLRCFEGLEGIDYIQDVLLQDRTRFWVIGSGLVGWQYLNCISNFEAYCGNSLILPELEGEQLKTWLQPIVDEFEISFAEPDLENNNTVKQQYKELQYNQTKYFNRLASVSQGISSVAVQIFLQSICYEPVESNTEEHSGLLRVKTPELPSLNRLEQHDLYVLYSLLLHGDLTLSALADSLGDPQSSIKGRVRVLQRVELIQQQDDTLSVNTIHYPRLKKELDNNNFIIDESD